MINTNFKPIFDYIDNTKKEILDEIIGQMAIKTDSEKVLTAVDDTDDKVVVLEKKSEQIERWVIEASKKVEVSYNP